MTMTDDSRGSMLVEMMIACLLMALAVSVAAGSLLNSARLQKKSQEQEQASLHAARLLQELKNYVTADPGRREGAPGDPPGSWRLPGDPCGCWALAEGEHDATALLPPDFRQRHAAAMTYTVSLVEVRGLQERRVQASVEWKGAG